MSERIMRTATYSLLAGVELAGGLALLELLTTRNYFAGALLLGAAAHTVKSLES